MVYDRDRLIIYHQLVTACCSIVGLFVPVVGVPYHSLRFWRVSPLGRLVALGVVGYCAVDGSRSTDARFGSLARWLVLVVALLRARSTCKLMRGVDVLDLILLTM